MKPASASGLVQGYGFPAEEALEQANQAVVTGLHIGWRGGGVALDDQEDVAGGGGDLGLFGLADFQPADYVATVVDIAVLAGPDRFRFGGSDRVVALGARRHADRDAARDGVEVVGAERQFGFQRDRVVDIDQRADTRNVAALLDVADQRLGGGQKFAGRHPEGFVQFAKAGVDGVRRAQVADGPLAHPSYDAIDEGGDLLRRRQALVGAQQQGIGA